MEGTGMTSTSDSSPSMEAYVGPRPFRMGQKLYGRDRETSDVVSLLISRRLVLLHSPSGAGKTSLIQAAVIPKMLKRRFEVPMQWSEDPAACQPAVIRVNREHESGDPPQSNRYLLSAMLSLDLHRLPDQRLPLADLAQLSFDQYLEEAFPAASREVSDDATDDQPFRPLLVVFDQFEELVTLDPTDEAAKLEFMRQVGAAFENRGRWALFAIREDFLGVLEPFLPMLPSGLTATYHLDLLRVDGAATAIRAPAAEVGVTFADGVVDHLVNDLRQIRVQNQQGESQLKAGPYVEPVHLQVVCQSLWNAKGDAKEISFDHLKQLGRATGSGVDDVLAGYYSMCVVRAAAEGKIRERTLRAWFTRQLIGAQRVRRPVLVADALAFGITLHGLEILDKAFLIRREQRSGALWYELAHDRLMTPVLNDNEQWQRANLKLFQIQAEQWHERERPGNLLLTSVLLDEADNQVAASGDELTATERDFLEASRNARDAAQAERERLQASHRLRRLTYAISAAVGIIALLTTAVVLAISYAVQATRAEHRAELQAYAGLLSQAQHNWQDGTLNLAWQRLEATTPEYRGWEFEYLKAMFSRDRRTFSGHGASLPELEGHRESVNRVLVKSDGKSILTCSEDWTIKIWDADTRQVRSTLNGHKDAIECMALSSADEHLVSGDDSGTLIVWKASGDGFGVRQELTDAHADAILDVEWSLDGSWFVSCGRDELLRIWRRPEPKSDFVLAGTLKGHAGWVTCVAMLSDGRIISAGTDSSIRIWNAEDQTPDKTIPSECGGVTCLACDPEGRWIVVGRDNAIVVRDADTHEILARPPALGQLVTSAVIAPDGSQIVTGFRSGSVAAWNTINFGATSWFQAHAAVIRDITFGRDGTSFYTAAVDGLLKRWNGPPAPDPRPMQKGFGPVWSVAWCPLSDSDWFATAHADGNARIWDAETKELRNLLKGHTMGIWAIAVSPDGKLVATGSRDNTVRLWDAASGEVLHELNGKSIMSSVAFVPNAARLISGGYDGIVRIWDTETGQQVSTITPDQGELNQVSVSPDGKFVASCGEQNDPRIWNLRSESAVRTLIGHSGGVYSIAWSSDGRKIATGGEDGTARVWDASNGKELLILKGHSAWVTKVVFSPEGDRLATCSEDNSIKLWELAFGQDMLTLHDHKDTVWGLSFSAEGNRLASVSEDWTIRLWYAKSPSREN